MQDRELLELAAKAAGIEIDPIDAMHEPDEWYAWNPLNDDDDALRLAVKLGIQIGNPYQYRKALAFIDTGHGVDWEYREHWEDFDGEPYAATRRAITRAAAEIGKQK